MQVAECPLCHASAAIFEASGQPYFQCVRCWLVFLDPVCRLSPSAEKERYLQHNNDIEDKAYQNFVSPIVKAVKQQFKVGHHEGLDFGAGTGPVIAKLLRADGYALQLYDPFFCQQPEALQRTYDFIVCCEVIEHFYYPDREFALLKSLLKPGGFLWCMTVLYSAETDFKTWYYRKDQTHVVFLSSKDLGVDTRPLWFFSGGVSGTSY
jgi:SAM-dependent methyltransferase